MNISIKKWVGILSVIAFLIIGCGEDEYTCSVLEVPIYESGLEEYGWATALKNGREFRASGYYINSQDSITIAISFGTYGTAGESREALGFRDILPEIGRFALDPSIENPIGNSDAHYSTALDDVLEDYYILDPDERGWVEIISIDTLDTEVFITGNFEAYFILFDDELVNPRNPEKPCFTEGTFRVRLREE